jgi:hypothetical protein
VVLINVTLEDEGFTAVLAVGIPKENEFWNVVVSVEDGTAIDVEFPAVVLGKVVWSTVLDTNEVEFG